MPLCPVKYFSPVISVPEAVTVALKLELKETRTVTYSFGITLSNKAVIVLLRLLSVAVVVALFLSAMVTSPWSITHPANSYPLSGVALIVMGVSHW